MESYVRRLRVQRALIRRLLERLKAHGCSGVVNCEVCRAHGLDEERR